jgi:hypothetical protein
VPETPLEAQIWPRTQKHRGVWTQSRRTQPGQHSPAVESSTYRPADDVCDVRPETHCSALYAPSPLLAWVQPSSIHHPLGAMLVEELAACRANMRLVLRTEWRTEGAMRPASASSRGIDSRCRHCAFAVVGWASLSLLRPSEVIATMSAKTMPVLDPERELTLMLPQSASLSCSSAVVS